MKEQRCTQYVDANEMQRLFAILREQASNLHPKELAHNITFTRQVALTAVFTLDVLIQEQEKRRKNTLPE